MRVLVACEFSGRVRDAFRARGHDAWSCDLEPTDSDSGHHLQCDILALLDYTWDLMIAFPPCTHLAVSGARYFKDKIEQQKEAIDFVKRLWEAPIPKIAIENPVGVLSTKLCKPSQIIQPYQFGEDASKRTCLWLKGLPKLESTKYVEPRVVDGRKLWANQTPSGQNKLGPSPDRAKIRSITYKGIAEAMADQWGGING